MILFFLSLCASLAHAATNSTFQPSGVPFESPVTVAPGLSASVIFSNLTTPRGITLDSHQNILVVERGLGVTAFSPVTSPSVGWERTVVVENENLTQGIQVDGRRLYVSTAGEVILYQYNATTKSVSSEPPIVVVSGLPPDGDLTTHTIQLVQNPSGTTTGMLIGSGPLSNIDVTARDPDSGRSQVRLFTLTDPSQHTWLEGDLIAYGIRNPAGFAFSPSSPNSLYIVENGASIDNVTGLTAAFVNDNPADEIELVHFLKGGFGKFFGFPDCTTLWNPLADPVGDPQYVYLHRGDQISLHLEAERNDTWCQDPQNNVPPALSFQAHSVPLDIKFYTRPKMNSSHSLPSTWLESAFVSFHGSFDRVPPTGYGIVHILTPIGTTQHYDFVIQASNLTSCPGTCIRPVGLVFSDEGRLFASSDSSGELFVIEAGY